MTLYLVLDLTCIFQNHLKKKLKIKKEIDEFKHKIGFESRLTFCWNIENIIRVPTNCQNTSYFIPIGQTFSPKLDSISFYGISNKLNPTTHVKNKG